MAKFLSPAWKPQGIAWRIYFLGVALLMAPESASTAPPQPETSPRISARQLRLDGKLPIPEPKPIVMDESWMQSEDSSADSGLAFNDTPPDQPPDPPLTKPPGKPPKPPNAPPGKPLMPGEEAIAPSEQGLPPGLNGPPPFGSGGPPMMSGSQSETALSQIEFPLSEIFTLRAFEQIGKTVQVVTNRDEFILVLGASRTDGMLSKPADSIRVVGRKLGEVELTLIGERGVKKYRLKITPSVAQIEALIARQFPLSSVEVTAAGDHMLVVDGSVESPGEVEEILQLVQDFVGRQGKVINGIKVAGVMQVQLEVVIARVDRSELRRLGLNFEYAGKNAFAGSQLGSIGGITPIASGVANTAATAGGNAFQSVGGAATSVITPASTAFVGVTNNIQQFMAQIEALQIQGVTKVLAKPILVTLNGRPAEFLVGGEQPFPYQTSALSTPSVDFKKFGTRLNFVPVILGPDKIRLDLVPEHSSVNFTQAINVGGNQIPQFITQRIHTTVEMEPGQTLVLGGLLQTEINSQIQKLPFLGNLPLIGPAFRRVSYEERELELIVIVTPRLVHPRNDSECPLPLPGDESRRPTDKELYFRGLPEAPLDMPEAGDSGFVPYPQQTTNTRRRNASGSAKTVVQPVADHKSDRTSKSWLRLPNLKRKLQPSDKMNQLR